MDNFFNIAGRLTLMAQAQPDVIAVVEPLGRDHNGKRRYRHITFRQLDQDSDLIAGQLRDMGIGVGTRLALMVRPGIDFISLVFALFKAGAVVILIDPGMGRLNLIDCLAEAQPEGFIAVPIVHAFRVLLRRRFSHARFNVTVGRRWFWGGPTLEQLRRRGHLHDNEPAPLTADSPAAIIFTTGSTGPPKGVLYTHGNFDAQVRQIRDRYDIQPGEVDLPCFPLFGLFNCAMGVTAVIPDMDPSRPAMVDPQNIIEAVRDWNVTQTFGSPAIWDRVGRYCQSNGIRLESVRRVLSAGAPVSAEVLRRMKAHIHPDGDIYTPYGATEALPVASISAGEVLGKRNHATSALHSEEAQGLVRPGAGVCVGTRFADIRWKVVRISDGSITSLDQAEELPTGEIGELIVCGPQVTREYVTRRETNVLAKIIDGKDIWHRMGDCGYLDAEDRFWFCGRVGHRVLSEKGPMYPVCCEAVFNQHPAVRRSALVGVGPAGRQRPVIVIEPQPGKMPTGRAAVERFVGELRLLGAANDSTADITDVLFHPAFPVDIRHNAKIFREKLARWATKRLASA